MQETEGDDVEHMDRTGSTARKQRLFSRCGLAAAVGAGVVVLVTGGCSADDVGAQGGGGEEVAEGGTPSNDAATTADAATADAAPTDAATDADAAAPLVCGDGIISNKEVCDDGNLLDGDGCNAACAVATCLVPVSHPTVTAALADTACTTVYVHSGTYKERITIARDVTIRGVGALPVELDGEAGGTVVTVATGKTVTLASLTVKNGKATNGGGIVNAGGLTLLDAKVTDNVASGPAGAGGGIYQSGGSLVLQGTLVAHNHAQTTGPDGGNDGSARGGGIYAAGGALTLGAASKVEENDVVLKTPRGIGQGGGIYAASTTVLIAGASMVRLNTVDVDGDTAEGTAAGGGIFQSEGVLNVKEGSAIDSNMVKAKAAAGDFFIVATAAGAGAYLEGINLVVGLEDALVRTNEARTTGDSNMEASGGGMYVSGGSLTALRTTFSGNKASAVGGALTQYAFGEGGNLILRDGTVKLTETKIMNGVAEGSSASADYGGTASGGGISATSALTLQSSTVSKNRASSTDGSVSGGGVNYQGLRLDIMTSSLADNTAVSGGGGANGGALHAYIPNGDGVLRVSVTRSTLSGNVAEATGQALGGAIHGSAGTGDARLDLRLTSSTFSGNQAKTIDGSAAGGAIYARTSTGRAKADVTLSSCTIAANHATVLAGGLYVREGISDSVTTVTMRNTLVAGNTASSDPDCVTSTMSIASAGYNLIGEATSSCSVAGDTTGNLSGPAGLGLLANNGGPTLTHALLAASIAKNAGNPAGCTDETGTTTLTLDQRGSPRVAGGRCDIGAVESP